MALTFFCMAECCDTLQSKEERNREYKLCLNKGTIVHLLDVRQAKKSEKHGIQNMPKHENYITSTRLNEHCNGRA